MRRFRANSDGTADLITRVGWNALHLITPAGRPFDLIDYLHCLPPDLNPHEVNLRTPLSGDEPPLALHRAAARKGKTLDPRSLIAAGFMILATSLPKNGYSGKAVLAVYRLRWQIELAFKRLKFLLHIDKLPTWTDDGSRSWLCAHLILALYLHCRPTASARISWNLPPEDMLDAAYAPSLWAVQNTALLVLLSIVLGPLSRATLTTANASTHRRLANAPRKRKPHISYPVRDLFGRLWGKLPFSSGWPWRLCLAYHIIVS